MKHTLKERYTQQQTSPPSYALPQIPKPMPMLVPAFPRVPFYYPIVNPQMLYRPIAAFRGAILPTPTPNKPTADEEIEQPREHALDTDSPPQKRRRCDDIAYDAHVECPHCRKHFNKVLFKRKCSKCEREFCTAFAGPRPYCPRCYKPHT